MKPFQNEKIISKMKKNASSDKTKKPDANASGSSIISKGFDKPSV
jgi:hypothetical protein